MQAAPQGLVPLSLGGAGGPGPRGHLGVPMVPVLPAGDGGYRPKPARVPLALHCHPQTEQGLGWPRAPQDHRQGCAGGPGVQVRTGAQLHTHTQTHTPLCRQGHLDVQLRRQTDTCADRRKQTGTQRWYGCTHAHPTAHAWLQIHQHVHPQMRGHAQGLWGKGAPQGGLWGRGGVGGYPRQGCGVRQGGLWGTGCGTVGHLK